MVNQLGKYVPNLSTIVKPLNDLLQKNQVFVWDTPQREAFKEVKRILTTEPVLATFDSNLPTKISADSSSCGLGAGLFQTGKDGVARPVMYASRTLSPAETRYAQIEKEALALTWACERFRDFILGSHITLETDHKPLLQILGTKGLDSLTPRLQKFRIRLMRFSYDIVYTPGKDLATADALSRAPLKLTGKHEDEQEVEACVNFVVEQIPASDNKLRQILHAQQEDVLTGKLKEFVINGWPPKDKLDAELKKYWSVRDELTVHQDLLMRGIRIVIPRKLRQDILEKIHAGHLGITKCRARAQESVWWPGLSTEIAEMIKRCQVCIEDRTDRKEPLIPSEFPSRPWQKVGLDLFKLSGKWYLVLEDFYSRFPEVREMRSLTARESVEICKSFFSRHGVPEEVRSDCGSQFQELDQSEFRRFAKEWGFTHVTSSPRYPQSKGFAESAVKTVKKLLKKNTDPYKALLEYRATPLFNGFSPAELSMGRKVRSILPMDRSRLLPTLVNQETLREREEKRRTTQKEHFDRRHGAREKDEFGVNDDVWIKDLRVWGKIQSKAGTPRSYNVRTPDGVYRRNSSHLVPSPPRVKPEGINAEETLRVPEDAATNPPNEEVSIPTEAPRDDGTSTPIAQRKGKRNVKPPRRLIDELGK